ncbi:unnamed protein product [Vicia faba]|uniref:Uncharacterized protein n=1 Tax=Vicia faba TaxID=3906 RepID=A0AAV1AMI4_VICFA|nr:unnamed protein product [Vicia faba]
MNVSMIMKVKICSQEVMKLANIEESLFRQRSKIDWIRLGDNNNAYFHANLKSKYKQAQISKMINKYGNTLVTDDQIEKEVYRFYQALVGVAATNLKKIDIEVMRDGKQLNKDHCQNPAALVTDREIHQTLMKISDLTSSIADGYGASFFKASWYILKADTIEAIQDFFLNGKSLIDLSAGP